MHRNRTPDLPATPQSRTSTLARLPASVGDRSSMAGTRNSSARSGFRLNRRVEPQCESVRPLITPRAMPVKDSARDELRLLSFNIQVEISTSRYRHYLTHGWKHLLPH